MKKSPFKTEFSERIFRLRYAQGPNDTWEELARRVVEDVCGRRWGTEPLAFLSTDEQKRLISYITEMKFIPGGRYLYYCSALGTKVLKADYTWDVAENIQLGDSLIGFDEAIYKARFRNTTVTGVHQLSKPTYRIKTSLGEVTVSDCHQFVAKKKLKSKHRGDEYRWIKASDLQAGNVVAFSSVPWEVQTDFDAGWLSGILDGEGTVSKGSISVSQKPGLVLDQILRVLDKYKIRYYVLGRDKDTVKTVCIRGRWESCKVLGMFRPLRLLENWYKHELGAFWSRINPPAIVESVEFLGEQTVVAIETSTKTLITNGFLSHNCGRSAHFWNNCFLLRAEEDTREEWASLAQRSTACLMSGGGIGVDYSCIRPNGRVLKRTGGIASGPIPLMKIVNEIGRNVMQGGSRRSAIYASLNWQHEDINEFLTVKDWSEDVRKLKAADFNFPATLDMTNVSINWDTKFLTDYNNDGTVPQLWYESVRRMMKTGEPGHSYNFYENENETLRNACAEVTSEDDSDCCNLGSVHLANIANLEELRDVTRLAGKFLVCGTLRGDLPIPGAYKVREKNRRIGVGLMGIHEWMLQRNLQYGLSPELETWLQTWKEASEEGANGICDRLYLNRPVKYRAIAPTGTVGILASTSTGLEPLFAVAYKRRYLVSGTKWKHEYVVDATAKRMIEEYGINPDQIETAYTLALDPERRIAFQAGVQKYVDHSIASTLNLPAWGTEHNNDDKVKDMADLLLKYCGDLRGITCYPNGARGGQPLTVVPYADAVSRTGVVFDEDEEKACAGGVCGL